MAPMGYFGGTLTNPKIEMVGERNRKHATDSRTSPGRGSGLRRRRGASLRKPLERGRSSSGLEIALQTGNILGLSDKCHRNATCFRKPTWDKIIKTKIVFPLSVGMGLGSGCRITIVVLRVILGLCLDIF